MPSRNRDYARERAARDARSIERYGVTYNQRDYLERKAQKSGLDIDRRQVRDILEFAKQTERNPREFTRDLIDRRKDAADMRRQGKEIPPDYFDTFDDGDGAIEVDQEWLWYH